MNIKVAERRGKYVQSFRVPIFMYFMYIDQKDNGESTIVLRVAHWMRKN